MQEQAIKKGHGRVGVDSSLLLHHEKNDFSSEKNHPLTKTVMTIPLP